MDTTKLYIYGASGHGKVIADIARACGYAECIFIDDGNNEFPNFDSFTCKGQIVIAIGDNDIRKKLSLKIKSSSFELVTLIHPSSTVSPSATFGSGTVVMPQVVVNADATIGENVILNTGAIIEHDCFLEECVHISPNAALAGGVYVKELSHVGIGATIIQNITIGKNCMIGAGATVIKNVDDNCVMVGTPAKKLKDNR